MKIEIQKILEKHKDDKIITWKAVNEILLLSVINKNDVSICPICEKYVLINNVCPKCTVELCSPLDGQIIIDNIDLKNKIINLK